MSAYHAKGNAGRANGKEDTTKTVITREEALSVEPIRQRTRLCLLPLGR